VLGRSLHVMRALRGVARAQLELLAAQYLVWRRPVGQLVRCDDAVPGNAVRRSSGDRGETARIANAIQRAARYGLFRPRCLVRALALHRTLEQQGIAGSVVRIGVRRNGDMLLAHAWVEHEGLVLGDTAATAATFVLLTDARLIDLAAEWR
jgi:hypothetical protein